jgi:hypothetical protein
MPIAPRTGHFGEVEAEFEFQYLVVEEGCSVVFRFKQSIDLRKTKAKKDELECVEMYAVIEGGEKGVDVASAELACRAFFKLLTQRYILDVITDQPDFNIC